MSRLSSTFVRSFSAESPSSSFSDSRVSGAELKEGAAQPPLGRPPPEPPDPETTPGQENSDKTVDKRLQQDELKGRTTPHPETPSVRPLLRSISCNSPRESNHPPSIKFLAEFPPHPISCTKVATPINSKKPGNRLDCRSKSVSQGSQLLSTPPIPEQAVSTAVSEETKPHTNCEMVLCNTCTTITPILQRRIAMRQPIVNNTLYTQQSIIRQGTWKIDDKTKASISIYMGSHQHESERLINSHPVATCILDKFRSNFRGYRGDIKKRREKPHKEVAAKQCATPTGKLLPHWMDSSTGGLEHAFAEQFQTSTSIVGPCACSCDITLPILVVMLFRSAYGVSISLEHFVNSGCCHCVPYSHRVQWTLIKLKKAHDTTCLKLKSRNHEKSWKEIEAACNELNIIHGVYHTEKSQSWLIEYPHLVKIHLRPPDRLGKTQISCLYMQIPPFCFAVPLFESDGRRDESSFHLLKSHFTQVVCKINEQLLVERERFFERQPELRNEENLGLIYPYRFGPEAECRHLHITIDTSTSVE